MKCPNCKGISVLDDWTECKICNGTGEIEK